MSILNERYFLSLTCKRNIFSLDDPLQRFQGLLFLKWGYLLLNPNKSKNGDIKLFSEYFVM